MTDACYRFIVSGRVQGVYFRQSTAEQARRLGIDGWVPNLPDGRVEGVARGTTEALETLRSWLRHGPRMAHVSELQWRVEPSTGGEPGFEVRY